MKITKTKIEPIINYSATLEVTRLELMAITEALGNMGEDDHSGMDIYNAGYKAYLDIMDTE